MRSNRISSASQVINLMASDHEGWDRKSKPDIRDSGCNWHATVMAFSWKGHNVLANLIKFT